MSKFNIAGTIVFTYYHDLTRAADFYARILGLALVVDQGYAKIFRLTPHSFIGLVDSEKGTLKASETKSVIIATATGEVDQWYEHLQAQGVTIFKPLKQHDTIGVRGFMALDPEGYVLEFEEFLDTERNARMVELLREA
jgi:predicted enzyme related to lactoylglutathione lyase